MNCEYGRGQLELTIAPAKGLAAKAFGGMFQWQVPFAAVARPPPVVHSFSGKSPPIGPWAPPGGGTPAKTYKAKIPRPARPKPAKKKAKTVVVKVKPARAKVSKAKAASPKGKKAAKASSPSAKAAKVFGAKPEPPKDPLDSLAGGLSSRR